MNLRRNDLFKSLGTVTGPLILSYRQETEDYYSVNMTYMLCFCSVQLPNPNPNPYPNHPGFHFSPSRRPKAKVCVNCYLPDVCMLPTPSFHLHFDLFTNFDFFYFTEHR